MRAVVITKPGGPDVLEIQEQPTPEPQADQVRVRVHATSLNRADLLQRAGGYPAPPPWPPHIPGLEIAGVIDARGPTATGFAVGDRVFGLVGGGGYAEYSITTPDQLAPIPDNLDWSEAAAVPEVFMTAYDALFVQANLSLGERLLVHAIGSGVGTAALQLAKAAGATVYGTTRSPDKTQQAQVLGLDAAFNSDGFADSVRTATEGKGVDVLIDFVGAPYLAENLDALAPRGRMVIVGLMGGAKAQIDLGTLMSKRLQIFGTVLRSRSRGEKASLTARFAAKVVPLLAQGRVRPIVDRVFGLDEVVAAHTYMESNANFGKIVLRIV
jgi:NADPH2:quinone reductase